MMVQSGIPLRLLLRPNETKRNAKRAASNWPLENELLFGNDNDDDDDDGDATVPPPHSGEELLRKGKKWIDNSD